MKRNLNTFKIELNNALKGGYNLIIEFLIDNNIEFTHNNNEAKITILDKVYSSALLGTTFKEFVDDVNRGDVELDEVITLHLRVEALKKAIETRYCDNTRFEVILNNDTLDINLENDILTINDLDAFVYNERVFKKIEDVLA